MPGSACRPCGQGSGLPLAHLAWGRVEKLVGQGAGHHLGQLLHGPFALLAYRLDRLRLVQQAHQSLGDVKDPAIDVGSLVGSQPSHEWGHIVARAVRRARASSGTVPVMRVSAAGDIEFTVTP